ncbi:unnamed protein product [Microthlaspi erraticum]|uniref:F-box domain-containing protein n=1 Tax=Microthlaspi erraticum TaxID=1685480 RepID=A0A6D2HV32_9BRAS|nr:unnamed protein product [Microthlaspi erraticum]
MEKLKQKKKKKVSESDPIPTDLLIDIFSRVPGKSIERFRCLSKFWRCTLGLPYFTELFLTRSLARPRLLFAIKVDKELLFFSSPQPHNPVDNSTLVATRYRMYFPKYLPSRVHPPLRGSVFNEQVICNPVTGESITLPKANVMGEKTSFFGYDPINKQFKVLCIRSRYGGRPRTQRVLTLGTGKLKWRRTMECEPHGAGIGEIGINGVLYYRACSIESPPMLACFDFSSEKFSFFQLLQRYFGQLQSITVGLSSYDKIGIEFDIAGVTSTGEVVFLPYYRSNSFYIVYYNIERKTFARVRILGFEQFHHGKNILVNPFLDYVENMKLLEDRFIT